MGVPPSCPRFSTRIALYPRSATPRAASRPAGPPPMIRMLSLGIASPASVSDVGGIRSDGSRVHVVPGHDRPRVLLEPLQIILKLPPALPPVDPHLLQQRVVVGRVPVELADPVGVGSHG